MKRKDNENGKKNGRSIASKFKMKGAMSGAKKMKSGAKIPTGKAASAKIPTGEVKKADISIADKFKLGTAKSAAIEPKKTATDDKGMASTSIDGDTFNWKYKSRYEGDTPAIQESEIKKAGKSKARQLINSWGN